MAAHAKLSPSGASRWTRCTKSIEMEQGREEKESPYAKEGTEAHDLFERAVKAKTPPMTLEPDHPAAKDVQVAYDVVYPAIIDDSWTLLSEVKVKLTEDCWGTADIVAFDDKGNLVVIDYKHGKGVLVNVPCTQLDIYAIAAVRSLSWMMSAPVKQIETCIVQPRADHPDDPVRRIIRPVELVESEVAKIEATIDMIKTGDTQFCASEETCRWCKAKADCKACAELALSAARAVFTPTGGVDVPPVDEAKTLTQEEKLAVFEVHGLLSAFLTAVETSIQEDLASGKTVPGLKLVSGRSIRKWNKGMDEDQIMEHLTKECKLKKADIAPPKLLGPAKVEKLIDPKKRGGKKKMELLKSIIIKPEGKPTVVLEDDPRPSIVQGFAPVVDPLS